ncbi:DUF6498-containing protein [Ferruginibacter sp. SUN106]|uniref:DUF6498-containing protein n=1 Tax=Ferruginibacter sp. SUN106 TaxID=2978348 RepID=UPI003D365212
MFKNLFSNPSFLLLLAGNFYCIWYYENNPGAFATVVWIYWFQSITIGLFNFIELLTMKNFDGSSFKLNDQPVTGSNQGCAAWFFLVHYGFFHLGYAIFLLIQIGVRSVNKAVLLIGVAVFFLEVVLNFIRQKQMEGKVTFNMGAMFMLPYLRIIPMHLMILLPAFLGWKPSLIFLLLKMGADILSFLFYHKIYGKNKIADSMQ